VNVLGSTVNSVNVPSTVIDVMGGAIVVLSSPVNGWPLTLTVKAAHVSAGAAAAGLAVTATASRQHATARSVMRLTATSRGVGGHQ
jgi:hypothetical protein